MERGMGLSFQRELESGIWGTKDSAFRCVLPFRGIERRIRDAGSDPADRPRRTAVVRIQWSPVVAWKVIIQQRSF
jgi:hypothetical protein